MTIVTLAAGGTRDHGGGFADVPFGALGTHAIPLFDERRTAESVVCVWWNKVWYKCALNAINCREYCYEAVWGSSTEGVVKAPQRLEGCEQNGGHLGYNVFAKSWHNDFCELKTFLNLYSLPLLPAATVAFSHHILFQCASFTLFAPLQLAF